MKTNFYIIIIVSVLFVTLGIGTAQGQGYWEKTFGGTDDDGGSSVQQTTDGGYIIAGSTSSFGAGGSDVYLIKSDGNGNKQWSKTFGGTGGDGGGSVQQTTDGGYIIAGSTDSFGAGGSDVYLIKTDGNGNEQWSKTFGGSEKDVGNSVQQTTDGGYIIAGSTDSFGESWKTDAYLIKTDGNGNEQWSRTFRIFIWNFGNSVQQTTDGGYIITGMADRIISSGKEVLLYKTDGNGNEQWFQIFPGFPTTGSPDAGNSVQQTTDGGYIIAGGTGSFPDGPGGVYLIKTDPNGNGEWSETFGGYVGNSVRQTTDGGYIIAGNTGLWEAGLWTGDVYLIYYNPNPSFFVDVSPGSWAEAAIYKIYNAGITKGCSQNPLKYCPDNNVTRTQMSVFLGRVIHGSVFNPPPAIGIFTDLPVTYWAADWIEQFYNDGITSGCSTNPLRYCPYNSVTRTQMAVFLLRSKHGKNYTPPAATGIFSDVPVTYWAADWIEQLYNEGITTGCGTGPLRYCPENSVTRAQMAVFLSRILDKFRIQNPVNRHWYQRVGDTITWHDAKIRCESMDGYLATIISQQENQFIYDNMVDPIDHYCWLGGTDEANEGDWRWITGERWIYSNWDPGEPNNDCGDEDYLHIFNDRNTWNDNVYDGSCGGYGLMYPICEWE